MWSLYFLFRFYAAAIFIPLIQIPLRRSKNNAANGAAIVLLFVPSGLWLAARILFKAEWHDLAGIRFWVYELVTHAWGYFLSFWVPVFVLVALWFVTGAVYRAISNRIGMDHLLPRFSWMERFLMKFIPTALILTMIPAVIIDRYTTLEEAVRGGDLAMAEKRLESNILGHMARSTVPVGSFAVPLVQIAAERRDQAMVELLIRHGANPRDAELSN